MLKTYHLRSKILSKSSVILSPYMFHGTLTTRMHCNLPQLSLQLMVSGTWLFIFHDWTLGCDVNFVMNYLSTFPLSARNTNNVRLVFICHDISYYIRISYWSTLPVKIFTANLELFQLYQLVNYGSILFSYFARYHFIALNMNEAIILSGAVVNSFLCRLEKSWWSSIKACKIWNILML